MAKKKNAPARTPVTANAGETQPKKEVRANIKEEQAPIPDLFSDKLRGKGLYCLLAALIVACFIVFKGFIAQEKVYLFKDIGSDSINNYFPGLVQLAEY